MSIFAGKPRDYPLSLQSHNMLPRNKLAHISNELSWEFNVGMITHWELVYQMVFCLKFRFVSFCIISVMSGRSHGYMGIISTFFSESLME